MERKWKKPLALFLTVLLFFTGSLPVPAAEERPTVGASQNVDSGKPDSIGLCPHHERHTTECGYDAAAEGGEGSPCTYDCKICKVQALIDALPGADAITSENQDSVREQLEAIDEAKLALDDDALASLDFSRYEAAAAVLSGASGEAMPAEDSITIVGDWIFANGIPIVIRGNSSTTNIYGEDGTLLYEGNAVGKTICGGWWGGDHYGNPSVIMESGKVAAIYGGNYEGTLEGSSSVQIKSGTVDCLCGGGVNCNTTGSTHVTVEDGTIKYLLGGGQDGTLTGDTHITVEGGTITWLRGSGDSITQTGNTYVTIEDGTITGAACGNGYYAALNGDTSIVMNGGRASFLYGGGENGGADNSKIEVYGGNPGFVYGGGLGGSIRGKADIIIGENCNLRGEDVRIFGGGDGENATVGSAHFDISVVGQQTPQLFGSNVTGKVTCRFHGRSPQGCAAVLSEVDEVTVENGGITLEGEYIENLRARQLTLEKLEIASTGEATFTLNNKLVHIGELTGSGTLIFYGNQSKMPSVLETDRISASAQAPIKLERQGGMPEDVWTNTPWIQGGGVQALDSSDCFVFSEDGYVVQKTPDGAGIQIVKGDSRKQAVLVDPHFDKPSYQYGDTMTATMKLAYFDGGNYQPIPGVTVEIRTGPENIYTIASELTAEDGSVTFSLPVNDELWQNRETGLQAIFWGNAEYKYNFYGIPLNGDPGDMSFDVGKAAIALEGEIPAPVFGQAPVTAFPTAEEEFYTAELVWSPPENTFQINQVYTASIRILPKPGYSLDTDKIESISFRGETVSVPTPEADGSLILRDIAVFEALPGYYVNLLASPSEGGTVTGGGIYEDGRKVTATASAAEGWQFEKWTENGQEVSRSAEYTFTLKENRTLTAVFVKEASVRVNDLTVVPEGLRTLFESVAAIENVLRARVTAALSDVGNQIAFYDVRLQYRQNGGWVDVDPNHFPPNGVDADLPRPEGTNWDEYDFTVQHMISYGTRAGAVEKLDYIPSTDEDGNPVLRCHFTSLSPVAVGYQKKASPDKPVVTPDRPSVTPSRPETSTGSGRGHSSSSSARNDEYDFWQSVRKRIEAAAPGDTVTVSTGDYERMPKSVMDALRKKDGVTLVLRRDDGTEIVIPSEKALDEAMRVYYPLPYLEDIDFSVTEPVLSPEDVTGSKPNPGTGGWNPAWGPIKR